MCNTVLSPNTSANNVSEPSTKFSLNENNNNPSVTGGKNDADTPISNAGMEESEEKADPSEQPSKDKSTGNKSPDDVPSTSAATVEQEKSAASPVNRHDLKADNAGKSQESDTKVSVANDTNKKSTSEAPSATPVVPTPAPLPVLKGTLSYNIEHRRHYIRGNWNYENANGLPAQRFEYLRNLSEEEDVTTIPLDGEYHGSFSIFHVHTNAKGKRKEKTSVISENGVAIKFLKKDDELFDVKGQGSNDYGIFEIFGTAKKNKQDDGDLTYEVTLKKKYLPVANARITSEGVKKSKKSKGLKRKHNSINNAEKDTVPPPPSPSFPKDVVCMKGTVRRITEDDGVPQVMHKIRGLWSGGLDILLDDPKNEKGLCNSFDYEHRCTLPTDVFPLSGRYTGWFLLTQPDGSRVTVQERDVNLKFKKNSDGYYNVEGRGSNGFGKYTISGTMSKDNEITIFRHFQPVKVKSKGSSSSLNKISRPGALAPPKLPIGKPSASSESRDKSALPVLTLDDVVVPECDGIPSALKPPDHGAYSVVSRGVLKVDSDGQNMCTGHWAVTREQFTQNRKTHFNFGLKANHALQAAKMKEGKVEDEENEQYMEDNLYDSVLSNFPLDSANYYGQFKMKKGANKLAVVSDHQIVLKFRKNSVGFFNVHGLGVNELGKFDLLGTFLPMGGEGSGSGQIEIYRIYHPMPMQPSGSNGSISGGKQLLTAPELSSALQKKPPSALSSMTRPGHMHKMPVPSLAPGAHDSDTDDEMNGDNGSSYANSSLIAPSNSNSILPKSTYHSSVSSNSISPSFGSLQRSSSRQTKAPSRLEEDDPKALKSKLMDKCSNLLRFMHEKDQFAFFAQPVDPVALGIPTYSQVITNPMDFSTIAEKLKANKVENYEEFGRLVRLVFENAITFNVDVTHRVHQNAKAMLNLFNVKFKEIEKEGDKLKELFKKDRRSSKSDKGKKREKEKNKKDKRKRDEKRGDKERSKRGKNDTGYVSRTEYNALVNKVKMLELKMEAMLKHTGIKFDSLPEVSSDTEIISDPPIKKEPGMRSNGKKKQGLGEVALTREEQIELTETINELSQDILQGVVAILREDMDLEDDELDLDIDALETSTQRKLQRYVRQHSKPKEAKQKTQKLSKSTSALTPATNAASRSKANAPPKATSEKKERESKPLSDDSDTDSDTRPDRSSRNQPVTEKTADAFLPQIESDSDSDSDDDGDIENILSAFKPLGKSKNSDESVEESDDENNPFKAAQQEERKKKNQAEERKKAEDNMQKKAEESRKKHAEELTLKKKQAMEQKKQEEKRLEKEKQEEEEEREKERERLRNARNITQEVDLDADRDFMRECYDNYGGGSGSNSPSSDFGF